VGVAERCLAPTTQVNFGMSGTPVPQDIDPIGIILARVSMNPNTVESRALSKACLAVIATEGEFSDTDVFALGRDARGLLDVFAVERLTARYRPQDLSMIADKLRGMVQA
jgi:hypothetical protein